MIMKKLFFSVLVMSVLPLCAQKNIHIFNYSNLNLVNTLLGADQSNSNCFPTIQGTNYPIPVVPHGAVTYKSYRHSDTQVPPINSWTVTSGINIVNTLAAPDPQLDNLGIATDWMMNKFYVEDPNGGSLPYSGASIGTIGCNGQLVTNLQPTPSSPYPFEAFWFVAGGETYFTIQP